MTQNRYNPPLMQNRVELSFGALVQLSEDLIEVIIDEGVDINVHMVEEFHRALEDNLKAPFLILVNRLNRYNYTFEAQMKVADHPGIGAVAVVTYSRVSAEAANVIMIMPRKNKVNFRRFEDRESALLWLEKQRRLFVEERVLYAAH